MSWPDFKHKLAAGLLLFLLRMVQIWRAEPGHSWRAPNLLVVFRVLSVRISSKKAASFKRNRAHRACHSISSGMLNVGMELRWREQWFPKISQSTAGAVPLSTYHSRRRLQLTVVTADCVQIEDKCAVRQPPRPGGRVVCGRRLASSESRYLPGWESPFSEPRCDSLFPFFAFWP
jgi:hypothetical protein